MASIIVDTLINLPIAVLLMKSFFDDVPVDVDEAAMIDGATRLQIFWRVVLPMVKGGVAATAVLCFIFSWTEFLLSLFLTNSIRTLPVKITTFVTSTGSEWGFIAALGTSADHPELHLHPARPEATCPRPDPWISQGIGARCENAKVNKPPGGERMSFKKYDKQTFIIDTANAYTDRQHLQARVPAQDGHGRHRLLGLRPGHARQHRRGMRSGSMLAPRPMPTACRTTRPNG